MSQTAAERLEEFSRYRKLQQSNPDSDAVKRQRNRIAQQNDRLALAVARRATAICNVEFDDLAQISRIGLLKAIDRFEPERGNAFSSFAVPKCRGEILHHLRDHPGLLKIPRRWQEAYDSVKTVERKLLNQGRQVALSEIAMAKGIPAQLWDDIVAAIGDTPITSLEEVDQAEPVSGDEERMELRQMAIARVSELPLKMGQCVTERVFRRAKDAAIAKRLKIPQNEVKQLIEEGFRRLQANRNPAEENA